MAATKEKKGGEVVVIDNEIKPIVSAFKGKDIKSPKEMTQAVAFLSELNKIKDRIVADKEKITKPLNETLKEVRGRYKPAETQLDELIGELRSKIGAYQTEKLRLEAEAEAKIVNDKRGLKMETMERKFNEIKRVDEQVVTEAGMVKFRRDLKVTIMDYTMVPHEYVKEIIYHIDAIKKAHDRGEKVPGTMVEEIQVPINHR